MIFISKYQKYFIIIVKSAFLGLIRWAFLDRKFSLIPDQKITLDAFVSYQEMSRIIKDDSLPIVDARDFESYSEGFIGDAYNLDIDLLYESDQEMIDRIQYIINKYGYADNKIEVSDDSYVIQDVNYDDKAIIISISAEIESQIAQ